MPFAKRTRFLWQLRTRTLELGERTRIMAIVNLTPDSFSGDGLSEPGVAAGIMTAIAAFDGGVDIIDLGAESTRPGAEPISSLQEQDRLLPVLEGLLRERPEAIVSVDTYHAQTARAAALAGAEIINDVSGLLWDEAMAEAVESTRCGLVLMHTRGKSQDWREQPPLAPAEVLPLVLTGLREQLAFAQAAGVATASIVIDPGFGFGKLGYENFVLLAGLERLNSLGHPLLSGISRKGFLGQAVRVLQRETLPVPEARLTATIAANVAAILGGSHILRVHDLQAARESALVADALLAQATR
jgi:dihydropteroate synthase